MRIVIYLKQGADPNVVLNQLYQYTTLQSTVSLILLALVDGKPCVLSLKQMMEEFLKHRVQVIRRRTEFLLREAKRRGHVLEGQLIAISSLDEVIRICRTSPNRADAKARLQDMTVAAIVMKTAIGDDAFSALERELGVAEFYRMTEQQAEAVVRLQLGQLAALERDEIYREYSKLRDEIIAHETLLSDEANVYALIRSDLEEMRDRFGDDRKTEFSNEEAEGLDIEDLIPESEQVVSISHQGWIKRMTVDSYRVQHRGGKGVAGGLRDDDFVEHFFVASTHAYLLCITNRGQLYWLKVYRIPEVNRTHTGRSIANVLELQKDEQIASVIPVRRFEGDFFLLMATKNGLVKKTPLQDYSRPKKGGIIGINLEDGDMLIDVALVKAGDEVVLSTKNGMAIRFGESDARPMGRNTKGVKGINLGKDDELVGMVVADPEGFLLTVCENGYGKRTPFGPNTAAPVAGEEGDESPAVEDSALPPVAAEGGEEIIPVIDGVPAGETAGEGDEADERSGMRYRKQRRGGKGLKDIRTSERNGRVVRVAAVRDTDDVMVMTMQGMVNRTKVGEIRITGRNAQGVRIINLNDADKLASIAKVAREEVIEEVVIPVTPA